MHRILNSWFNLLIIVASISCDDKKIDSRSYLNNIDQHHYYNNEVIPPAYEKIYGTWRLDRIEGGIAGQGRPVDFNYLEVKRYGIYAVIKDNKILELGRIKVDTFDMSRADIFQVLFEPEQLERQYATFPPNTGYIHFVDDKMYIGPPCCDTFQRLFVKDDWRPN